MRRSPQEVVDTLAYALKEGKQGDELKVSELVKKTSMSYVTVSYYLDLIEHAQKNIPMIEVVEKPRNTLIKVLKEIDLKFSNAEYILLYLFDKGAFGEASAVPIGKYPKDIVSEQIDSFLLKTVSKKIFLSTDGIIEAARLAGIRADAAISPKNGKPLERGEFEIEECVTKWVTNPTQSGAALDMILQDFIQNPQNNGIIVDVA